MIDLGSAQLNFLGWLIPGRRHLRAAREWRKCPASRHPRATLDTGWRDLGEEQVQGGHLRVGEVTQVAPHPVATNASANASAIVPSLATGSPIVPSLATGSTIVPSLDTASAMLASSTILCN